MIIVRAPLRISYVGGGTDLPSYADVYGGQVVSTSIDKYVYVTLTEKFDGRVSLRYSETEDVAHTRDLKHDIVRECLSLFGVENGIEIVTISDVPMNGTGLGSSSALTVALLHALSVYTNAPMCKERLAFLACNIEIDKVGAPIGRQDQYASACGGFNHLTFSEKAYASVNRMDQDIKRNKKIDWLEDHTLLFHLDAGRNGNDILKQQGECMPSKLDLYHALSRSVDKMMQWIGNDASFETVGDIVHESWGIKREIADGIANPDIAETYLCALEAGALGGKVVGAGGGGFMLLIVADDEKGEVRHAMDPLMEMPFRFDHEGSKVIYDGRARTYR